MTDFTSSEENLREALVDLERAHQHDKKEHLETEGLLQALRVLTNAQNTAQMFDHLAAVLQDFIPFNDAFMLTLRPTGDLEVVRSTSHHFRQSIWQVGGMFQRVLNGETVVAFDTDNV